MNFKDKKVRGFTLIEVLISLVVAVVGIVAVLQLQGVFLGVSSESQKRAAATALAEREIEALRNFKDLEDYKLIGVVPAASASTVSYENFDFSVWRDVTAYNVVSGGVSAVSDATASLSDYKEVILFVSWDTADKPIELASIIGAVNPGVPALPDTAYGGSIPRRIHNPGLAPDVISVDVGDGKKKETSKPLPTVYQQGQTGDSTVVTFEVVTYDSDLKTERIDDFLTVSCVCKLVTNGSGLPPAEVVYNSSSQKLEDDYPLPQSGLVSKASGIVDTDYDSSQPNICIDCCRDHHDSSSVDTKYRWYWPDNATYFNGSGDHKHYWSEDGVSFALASTNNARYREVCRFKRMDGIYRLMKDWKLMDLTVMPSSYLASGALGNAAYSQYVVDYVEQLVDAGNLTDASAVSLAKPSGRDLTGTASVAVGSSTQVQARGIFVDDLPWSSDTTLSALSFIQSLKTASAAWLDKVPFYEINLALLSNWHPSDATIATVENDPVTTITNPNLNYYGVYFRGLTTGVSMGVTSIEAESLITNTGVVGHRRADVSNPIDPNGVSMATDPIFETDGAGNYTNTLSDSIQVEVTDNVSGLTNISGTFACIRADNSACGGSNKANLSLVFISKNTGGNCTITGSGNIDNFTWECNDISEAGYATVFSTASYEFSLSEASLATSSVQIPATTTPPISILIVVP
ncbi:type IV pilin [Marinobacterium nitratireducens]|uniref:Type IV pilin n=1 Tax=Marinobacterium nitratireducens TaxID=518897 RepID=A0A917ZPU9_9GAMM|nr:prepilin-type N-terminal cleavage/methylation domain-containing protein [Marinobacterium nitratireducens]GGO88242.1 type IV pilin [Marinobacterium nitratireducens]